MALYVRTGWAPKEITVGQDDRLFVADVLLGAAVYYLWWFDPSGGWKMWWTEYLG
jgi:hypothetical protein